MAELERLRVATYNVHMCVGGDRREDPGRVAEVIKELDADVIGLQEVHSISGSAREALQMHYLAELTGFNPIPGTTMVRPGGGDYGNVLLTALPVLEVRQIDISVPGVEPRGVLDVDLRLPGCVARVILTHLGLRPAERRLQVTALLQALSERRSPLVILLGDLNEWLPFGRPLRWLHRHFGESPSLRSFPARWPILSLDRIWVSPPEALSEVRVHRTALSREASDHLPIRAVIDVDTALRRAR